MGRAQVTVAPRPGTVQSLGRAFDLLELLADSGSGLAITQLAASSGLPLPTIHRILRSLMAGGYVRQDGTRRYSLGPGLIRLGEVAAKGLGPWALPYLTELVSLFGETANLAVLEGDSVLYVATVPSPHAVRLFTEVGRRVMPHCTGVGKALLSGLTDDEVRRMVRRTGMPAFTDRTLMSVEALLADLHAIRARGYALDDGEQEQGVRCVAIAVAGAPARVALSVSGPSARVTRERVTQIAPALQRIVERLAADRIGEAPTA